MSAIRFTFGIDDNKQFDRVFNKITQYLTDFSPIFNEMADEFYDSQEGVFRSEGKYDDLSEWTDLTTRYRKWKEKNFPGRKKLELTGALKTSLTQRGGYGNITQISEKEMILGSGIRVGRWNLGKLHQLGTAKMDARPPIRLSADLKTRWTGIIRKYLKPTNI